jgi:NagD protein
MSGRRTAPGRLFAGYVLDLDGTVYLDDALLPGAGEAIAALRTAGARIAFVTNKPLDTAEDYAAKLTRLGVPAVREDVVTALDALVEYLRERHAGARVLPVAEPLVHATLAEAGMTVVTEPARADLVVVSFDRTFAYEKLLAAYRAVAHHGAAIVATNPDPVCPTADGGLPDCAALLAALETCTGRRAEAVVGKPSVHMASAALRRLGLRASEVAAVGDRLLTDVALGRAAGMATVLVLSGVTTAGALAGAAAQPDFVLDGIHQLVPTRIEEPA